MSVYGKMMTAAVAVAALSGTLVVPSSVSFASPGPVLTPTVAGATPAPIALPVVTLPEAPATAVQPAVVVEEDDAQDAPASRQSASSEVDDELECLAKVVLHEAGNQSRAGRIAVAEVVMNRLNDPRGRFGNSICGVILQRGQFFNVHAYHPQRRDARWPAAVEIARQVRADMQEGDHDAVTNGGLFFRNSAGAAFRGRTRTVTIGAHHFYR